MADVYLTYVGKKPSAIDSIGGTGVVWNGHGDVQPVPEAVAEKLLKHPDQWQRTVAKAKTVPPVDGGQKKAGKGKKEGDTPPKVPEGDTPPVEPEGDTQPAADDGFAA